MNESVLGSTDFHFIDEYLDEMERRKIVTLHLGCLSISIPSLRMGGDTFLMAIVVDMLGGMPRAKRVEVQDIAAVPLTINDYRSRNDNDNPASHI